MVGVTEIGIVTNHHRKVNTPHLARPKSGPEAGANPSEYLPITGRVPHTILPLRSMTSQSTRVPCIRFTMANPSEKGSASMNCGGMTTFPDRSI